MRIGIEAQRLFRPKKHGMDIVALESIKALQRLDLDNEYVVFTRPGEDDSCLQESKNLKIVQIPAFSYADWELIQLPRAVEANNLDLLHCTSNTAPVGINVPLVLTVHDIIYLEKSLSDMKRASLYQKMGQVYRKWNVPKVVQQASSVLTVSEFEKENISQKVSGLDHKLDVIYNGVSTRFFDFAPPWKRHSIANKYDLPPKYILFLGNTDPKKNAENVLLAYAQYASKDAHHLPLVVADLSPNRVVQILGSGPYAHILDSIHYTGYVDPADMPILYGGATVFLYPSLRESFGLPIIEAMASSTPVITSDCSSMPEVAGDAAVLVDPTSPEHMAQMIRILVNDPSLRWELKKRGRNRARNFTWDNAARQLLGVYQRVVAQSHRTSRTG